VKANKASINYVNDLELVLKTGERIHLDVNTLKRTEPSRNKEDSSFELLDLRDYLVKEHSKLKDTEEKKSKGGYFSRFNIFGRKTQKV